MELVILRGGEGDGDVLPHKFEVAGLKLQETGQPAEGVIFVYETESHAHECRF